MDEFLKIRINDKKFFSCSQFIYIFNRNIMRNEKNTRSWKIQNEIVEKLFEIKN